MIVFLVMYSGLEVPLDYFKGCVFLELLQNANYYFCSPLLYIALLFYYLAGAPKIDTASSLTLTIPVGSSLTLNCTSRGSPPDTFTWRKDNDPTVLQSTSITEVTYNANSAVFRADYSINNVTTSDSGTYTCNVTNPIGSDSAIITVDVLGMYIATHII